MSHNNSRRSKKDLIRMAALRNVEGATHLADEELEDAIANFTVAYHCLKTAMDPHRLEEDEEEDSGSDSSSTSATTTSTDRTSSTDNTISSESVDKYHFLLDSPHVAWYAASQSNTDADGDLSNSSHQQQSSAVQTAANMDCFVYNEALVFHPESASDPEEALFFQAVLWFNLALTFHRQAVLVLGGRGNSSNATATTSSLQQALTCYNKTLDQLRQSKARPNLNTQTKMNNMIVEAHVLFASLNNKAQALFALQDYNEALYTLQELHMLMDAVEGCPPGFEDLETRGMEGTLELLNGPEITAIMAEQEREHQQQQEQQQQLAMRKQQQQQQQQNTTVSSS